MARVALFLGSGSDKDHLHASKLAAVFKAAGVECRAYVSSAHRHSRQTSEWIADELAREVDVFIAAAGMSAALPGFVVSALLEAKDPRLVLGVALPSRRHPNGKDAESAIIELPPGVDAVYAGFGSDGLTRAAVAACQSIGRQDERVRQGLREYLAKQAEKKQPEADIALTKEV